MASCSFFVPFLVFLSSNACGAKQPRGVEFLSVGAFAPIAALHGVGAYAGGRGVDAGIGVVRVRSPEAHATDD